MSHWTEGLEQDDDDPLVRPFTITRGRTAPQRSDLGLITVVITIIPEEEVTPRPGIEPEHRRILQQCREPAVVAEVSAALKLPVSVTKILIGDLIEAGFLIFRAPARPGADGTLDLDLLQAVREGLERL
ncbi:DUF742 domain-containing protein [Streptomyces odontomachi]|uniref:DUF742 domain-containing protein n=1 Tax=Streptomyces odontomachi TaxID=2944940 RepID=UPI00210E6203|nr:DUF742 domain-containing protein [Streptomyces sp. ODS25]